MQHAVETKREGCTSGRQGDICVLGPVCARVSTRCRLGGQRQVARGYIFAAVIAYWQSCHAKLCQNKNRRVHARGKNRASACAADHFAFEFASRAHGSLETLGMPGRVFRREENVEAEPRGA